MRKDDFLQMMWQDNETESEPMKTLYADIIECMDIALSQSPDTLEIASEKTVKGAYELIEKRARERQKSGKACVGPFEAAEIIAEYLGTKYERASKRLAKKKKVSLEDFI